jgi:hypothetical protein
VPDELPLSTVVPACNFVRDSVLPRIVKLERDMDAAHVNLLGLEQRLGQGELGLRLVQTDHAETRNQLAVITDGYETIIREVRNTRTEIETLFTRLARDKLEAAERHSKLLMTAMRGVFILGALAVTMAGLHAVVTGEPLQQSLINLLRGVLGWGE